MSFINYSIFLFILKMDLYFCDMEKVLNIIRNKYIIAIAAFVIWMSFFDRHDIPTQLNYMKEKASLEKERDFYLKENEQIIETIKNIKDNKQEIQRIAREKYKMKKDNEDIYVVSKVKPAED